MDKVMGGFSPEPDDGVATNYREVAGDFDKVKAWQEQMDWQVGTSKLTKECC
jgi:hypothetical protein